MACMTIFAQPFAMTTTQLARVVHYDEASTLQFECNVEHNSLRMSWVVVTDRDGSRRLCMRWASDNDQ